MGNTCFVNSTLQVLLAVPEFANLLQSVCAHSTNLPLTVQLLNQIAMMRTAGDSVAVQEALWSVHELRDSTEKPKTVCVHSIQPLRLCLTTIESVLRGWRTTRRQ